MSVAGGAAVYCSRAVVGGPAMAWPLYLPRNFFKYSLPFKVIAQLPPPYDSTSALHDRATFQKPTSTLCSLLLTVPAYSMRCRVYVMVACPYVCPFDRAAGLLALLLNTGKCSRYRSTAAGAWAAAAGSVVLRAEVRGSSTDFLVSPRGVISSNKVVKEWWATNISG